MSLLACDGNWQQGYDGQVFCYGTLEEVSANSLTSLPPLTYEDADMLLALIGAVYASIWVFRQIRRLF